MIKKTQPTRTTSSVKKKSVTRTASKVSSSVPARKRVVTRGSRSTLSKIGTHAKRGGKIMLRSALLSRTVQTASKIVVASFIFCTALYGAYSFVSNTFAGDVVISKSEIVSRVGKLTTLPVGNPDAVVRVEDAETLKKQNIFYENVKEGDYIIMYPTIAVIYSLRTDSIVAIKTTTK